MPNITPARLSLALAALLACKPGTGDTASDTDPSTGSTTSTATTTSATDTEGDTSTSDPSTGPTATSTSTSTSDGASTTPELTTWFETSTTKPYEGTSTTTWSPEPCGTGWCTTKDFINIILYDNHEPPHELVIPAPDLAACVELTYEFTGPADHTHTVTLTPDHIYTIDQGGQIEVESSEAQGHTHLVWSDCE